MRNEVRAALQFLIKDLGLAFDRIVVTGHSMGGALSVLCAADLKYYFEECCQTTLNIELYTFGSPRVGNTKFTSLLTSNYTYDDFMFYRMTHRADPVPWVPMTVHIGFACACACGLCGMIHSRSKRTIKALGCACVCVL